MSDQSKRSVPEGDLMNSPILQLLVLAGIAVFLILRLRSVLGTRDGFEKPPVPRSGPTTTDTRGNFEVIEGGPDHDIIDHVPENSPAAGALARMKQLEPSFSVSEFLSGARGAYEMILMGFEKGEMADIKPFLSNEVYESFAYVVNEREAKGLTVEADFVGVKELQLVDAELDEATREGELTVRFVGQLTFAVRDRAGEVIEGDPKAVKTQRDVWTFARNMGSDDPNWQLVATGE
ncbi:Predicted lipid-binding transport protein, Tim44 family [Pseudooceanicola nitratireducens]|mgnify:CR=1 FL=1|jgi:predicted lipid-binding transport protein (Tim44 family)|uniref:Predicted lipid-binding transport protein, Tim44 family n=2 Tax=Pseudooceanicola nitratireducens TaxID=517719 RepID=A0A1I1H6W1_9RHOB|nr:Predicted lipid-binding transport protein, Tim44 family [Pseudooceanicola nitratireducens]SFC19919.1 Predicted lipid-binding transport protein, Tim44 family [Pseudooceanicola nitratireducens]